MCTRDFTAHADLSHLFPPAWFPPLRPLKNTSGRFYDLARLGRRAAGRRRVRSPQPEGPADMTRGQVVQPRFVAAEEVEDVRRRLARAQAARRARRPRVRAAGGAEGGELVAVEGAVQAADPPAERQVPQRLEAVGARVPLLRPNSRSGVLWWGRKGRSGKVNRGRAILSRASISLAYSCAPGRIRTTPVLYLAAEPSICGALPFGLPNVVPSSWV